MPRHYPVLLLLHGVDVEREEGMAARRVSVELVPCDASVLESFHVELEDFLPSSHQAASSSLLSPPRTRTSRTRGLARRSILSWCRTSPAGAACPLIYDKRQDPFSRRPPSLPFAILEQVEDRLVVYLHTARADLEAKVRTTGEGGAGRCLEL